MQQDHHPVMNQLIRPMLADTGQPFDSPDFVFEIKWDGIRCLAFLEGAGSPLRLQSRNLLDLTSQYPDLSGIGEQVSNRPCILDGEVIAMRDGRPSFAALQKRMNVAGRNLGRLLEEVPVMFVAFDLLYHHDRYVMNEPFETRRNLMLEAVRPGDRILISEAIPHSGKAFYEAACQQQLEGIMAKQRRSVYVPGKRSKDWIKIKRTRYQIFSVCGYFGSPRRGEVSSILVGALLNGEWHGFGYVGSGFSGQDLSFLTRELPRMAAEGPPGRDFPTGGRRVNWVRPSLVCLVEYLELTGARTLRHPTFRGFCPDMQPSDCHFEEEGVLNSDWRCKR